MEVFRKCLKANDVKDRLSFPTKRLNKLAQRFRGRHADLPVKDRSNRFWRFRCTLRNRNNKSSSKKNYLKPVLSGDWHSFVVSKDLRVGDVVKLLEETDQSTTGQVQYYRVEVKRKINIRLFGVTIHDSVLVL